MKRSYALALTVSLGILSTASAQLPNVKINGSSAARNRATVRVPGASASKAARIRAGANLDGSRLRLNANARSQGSVRAGRVGDVRASSRTNAAIETRRRAQNNGDAGTGTSRPALSQTGNANNQIQLRTSLEFRNRLAEIERMRDVAVQRGDVQLMQRADQLEHALRLRHRALPPQGDAQTQTQAQGRQQTQAAVQGGRRFQGSVQGQSQVGAEGTVPSQQQFETNARNGFRRVANQGSGRLNAARGQVQQNAAAAGRASGQAEADARARGEFTASGAAQVSNGLRQNASATGGRVQGQVQQRFDATNRAAGRTQTNVRGRFNNAAQSGSGAAARAFQQGQAAGDARVRGEINTSSTTNGRIQRGPIAGSANQTTRGTARFDAGRAANPQANPAPPSNPAPQGSTPPQGDAGSTQPQGNTQPQGGTQPQGSTQPRSASTPEKKASE